MIVEWLGFTATIGRATPEWTVLWLTADQWLVVFTVVLAIATAALWFSTYQLAETAKDTARRQLRAYLTVDTVEGHALSAGQPVLFLTRVINRGQTPAYDVRVRNGMIMTGNAGLEPDPQLLEGTRAGTVGPGAEFRFAQQQHWVLQETDLASIAATTAELLYVGVITYRDTFGKEWSSAFRCRQYRATGQGPFAVLVVGPEGSMGNEET